MTCTIDSKKIDDCIEFHGHVCPGLSIGIRAAEYCLQAFGHNSDEPVCAVCETDMCGVDAIQFLTGCTFGKGNLMHRDWGKTAFTFYRQRDGKGARLTMIPGALGKTHERAAELMKKSVDGSLTAEEKTELAGLRVAQQTKLMEMPLEELFEINEPQTPMPRGARILETLTCAECGEGVMESRSRRMGGQTLCIPCFEGMDQKR
ncbi:FmdE family protein [Salidesulfovibrio brasiliensis]|uniref:FmdE family protein n=1 Tax=Salidesulfovibrio brasiliensis TaxID=221711 RepID=UPI0006D0E02D|nr:FmdE family protein [Salidesulfovibrio brasiliensis]